MRLVQKKSQENLEEKPYLHQDLKNNIHLKIKLLSSISYALNACIPIKASW